MANNNPMLPRCPLTGKAAKFGPFASLGDAAMYAVALFEGSGQKWCFACQEWHIPAAHDAGGRAIDDTVTCPECYARPMVAVPPAQHKMGQRGRKAKSDSGEAPAPKKARKRAPKKPDK